MNEEFPPLRTASTPAPPPSFLRIARGFWIKTFFLPPSLFFFFHMPKYYMFTYWRLPRSFFLFPPPYVFFSSLLRLQDSKLLPLKELQRSQSMFPPAASPPPNRQHILFHPRGLFSTFFPRLRTSDRTFVPPYLV